METLKGFVDGWTSFIGTSITGLFLTTATAIFFYAVVRFILKRASGDAKGLDDAKSMLGWSVVALTVMFSIWGIVSFLQSGILGSDGSKTSITAPSISSGGSSSGSGSPSGSGSNNGTNSNYGNRGGNVLGSTSPQCNVGQFFDSRLGYCVASRTGDTSRPLTGVGGSCRISNECKSGLLCDGNSVCNQCNVGQFFDSRLGYCVASRTGGSSNTSSGGRVSVTAGGSCRISAECASGLSCNSSVCSQCPSGQFYDTRLSSCVNSRTGDTSRPLTGVGGSCRISAECASELSCVDAVCQNLGI